MEMKNKKTLIFLGVLAILVIIILFLVKTKPAVAPEPGAENAGETIENMTKFEVPEDVVVPELGEEIENKEIAVPLTVAQAGPQTEAMFRRFEISAENDKYSPSEVIVNERDTVHIDFTATDKEYDITFPDYGMKQTAKPGEKKILEFQAMVPGKFLYYCDLCGGLEGETKGYIIVVPKKAE
jgi:heme/copper-type cytochrome/quinol oxidase subunit 2